MQVHFINSGTQQDLGVKEVEVHSFKMDFADAPYAIVSNPFFPGDSLRAEYNIHKGSLQWLVDLS